MLRHLLEITDVEKKKQGGSRGQKKEQVAKGMKTSERHYEEELSTGKEILSHVSLELKCFLHAVDRVEAGRFAVERGCCAELHGEADHTSRGMNSKWNSSFHYRNSYKLINAIWVYICDTCLSCTFKACSCIDRASSASSKDPYHLSGSWLTLAISASSQFFGHCQE